MLSGMINTLKKNERTIVFTEGPDKRILEAASKLTQNGILKVILLGKIDEVTGAAKEFGFDISKCQIIDPENYD
ncbi:MAG: phosphate acetyltransferase, partial [Eubacterium sp.]|nr:phosphate acetyltransferase [Eubacterium sp.]